MKIAVFSDLHLGTADARFANLERLFIDQLQKFSTEGLDQLWLLGDIFDLFVGNYRFWQQVHPEVFAALETLIKKGCRVIWAEGNHDFHIRGFLENLGIEVFDGELELQIGRHKVYLAHGDLVNPDDVAYLRWRAVTRSIWLRRFLDTVPEALARRILKPLAERMSHTSRKIDRDPSPEIRERYRKFAQNLLEKGFDAVFLGHCHVEDLFSVGEKFYCNLGSGLDGRLRYAIWSPDSQSMPVVNVSHN